ncbi:MAG: glucosidase, partial [Ilumatobacteraceae bacterium]
MLQSSNPLGTGAISDEWRRWGPYVAERAWGTVREDYSADGDAWGYLPFDLARSRAFRWSEDGLGAICDDSQHRLLAFAFWNGQDPFLKERIFGLSGPQGNHGEDAKELWWYLDSTPTHSWMRWAYLYPQRAFPYEQLVSESAKRGRDDPEFELLDTGVFDEDRYWDITVDYAKAGPDDWCIRLRARNAGPDEATLHVLPTLWFRNTWSWGLADYRPNITATADGLALEHQTYGPMFLTGDPDQVPLACHNETNAVRVFAGQATTTTPKDGINDHVVTGAATVAADGVGTKAAMWYQRTVAPGETTEIRLRFSSAASPIDATWTAALAQREQEADEYYGALSVGATADEAAVMRQAFAGMMWGKQFFHYDVARWLDGDP